MAACTSRAASSTFFSMSNCRNIRVLPSVLRELIDITPEILPSERSSGVATLEAMFSGLAPDNEARTEIMGKDTCGNGATARK